MIKRYYFISTKTEISPKESVSSYRVFWYQSWFENHIGAFNKGFNNICSANSLDRKDVQVISFNKVK